MKTAARRAFTQVELLVVIGIIAIVIGLLIPMISHARVAMRRPLCASNLRQIGILLHAYANDNGGEIPAIYAGESAEPRRPTAHFNSMVSRDGGVGLLVSPPVGVAAKGYVNSAKIFICPGDTIEFQPQGADEFLWLSSWSSSVRKQHLGVMSFNYTYVPKGGDFYGQLAAEKSPAWHMGLFSGADRHSVDSSRAVMIERNLGVHPVDGRKYEFHGSGGNALYLDGHVEWLAAEETRDYGALDSDVTALIPALRKIDRAAASQ